jgi:hypothetical protein
LQNSHKIAKNNILLVALSLYIAGSIYLLFFYYSWITPDYSAYLNISRKYAEGNFIEAINAYWSPLISWLLVPFHWFHFNIYWAFKIINYVSGIGILWYAYKLAIKLKIHPFLQKLLVFNLIPITLFYASETNTPDFLMAFVWITFLYYYYNNDSNPYLISFLAIVCYFTKNYFLGFIIAFLIINFTIVFFQNSFSKSYLKRQISIITPFLVVLSIWGTFISLKYQRPLLSSAFSYNASVVTPEGIKSHFVFDNIGLIKPFESKMIFGWEDPSYYPTIAKSIFSNFKEKTLIVKYNLKLLNHYLNCFSYFKIGILAIILIPLLFNQKNHLYLGITATVYIYMMGYLALILEDRYLISVYILLVILVYKSISEIIKYFRLPKTIKLILPIATMLILVKSPVYGFINNWKSSEAIKYKYQFCESEELKTTLNNKNTASNDGYELLSLINYKAKSIYYGELLLNMTDEQRINALKKYQIEYYFHFYEHPSAENHTELFDNYLASKPIILEDKTIKIRIYKLD